MLCFCDVAMYCLSATWTILVSSDAMIFLWLPWPSFFLIIIFQLSYHFWGKLLNDDNSVSLQYYKTTVHNDFYAIIQLFSLRYLLTCHQQRTNYKSGYEIKEKEILRNFLFLLFPRISILENYKFLLQLRKLCQQ